MNGGFYMKTLIIGGVAGGASVAARLRRLDEQAEIIILERGEYISFANCGLPYYIGDVITKKEYLVLQTPKSFDARFRVEVRVLSEAVAINPEKKTVTVKNLRTGESYDESYDKLVLSPGAEPIRPSYVPAESDRIFKLRNIPDTYKIKDYITAKECRSAIVIGGGYIGLEMVENLRRTGMDVTLLQRSNQVLRNTLDYDMACLIHKELKKQGVQVYFNQTVTSVEQQGSTICVKNSDGQTFCADMLILAIGVTPESDLARNAGLDVAENGCIKVDEHLRTSNEDIYALGDAIEVTHFVSGLKAHIPLAGPANRQGRIVADNLAGIDSIYKGTQGTAILKCFDMTAAGTGLTEAAAKAAGFDYEKVYVFPPSHATYYPNACEISMKVLFTKDTGRILGAQLIGKDGVDKRCDVLATAMRGNMTMFDLVHLELSYAPPFSSAKDPVNIAGLAAENILTNKVDIFHYHDIASLNPEEVTLLDVRTVKEYGKSHIPDFINIPLDSLRDNLDKLDKSKPVYVTCLAGLRSYIACRILMQNGFTCKSLCAGYEIYCNVNIV